MKREEWLALKEAIDAARLDELASGSKGMADRLLMLKVGVEPAFPITTPGTVGEELAQIYRDIYFRGAIDLLFAMKEGIGLEDEGWSDSITDFWAGDIARRIRTVEQVGKDIGECIRNNYIYPDRCDREDCEHRLMDEDDEAECELDSYADPTVLVGVKEPGKPIDFRVVRDKLETWQGLVGGYIEVTRTNLHGIMAIVNEEGKLEGLEPNVNLGWDVLVGTVVFVGEGGENFGSLTEEDIKELKEEYDC